jgi:hypothetical protein
MVRFAARAVEEGLHGRQASAGARALRAANLAAISATGGIVT